MNSFDLEEQIKNYFPRVEVRDFVNDTIGVHGRHFHTDIDFFIGYNGEGLYTNDIAVQSDNVNLRKLGYAMVVDTLVQIAEKYNISYVSVGANGFSDQLRELGFNIEGDNAVKDLSSRQPYRSNGAPDLQYKHENV